ncbi:hypothetical protein B0F90DRAFT_156012 [Multifurca ochricompacta]|uniref:Uncharacterized protein n=1 Tax=Multifurca ochricompacta TaxID=376703 RepID=A0AAD4MDC2_9AGAM|nr:hypothetical protein B0F90DRAFT_156012 [Multifurca ochricompacta]
MPKSLSSISETQGSKPPKNMVSTLYFRFHWRRLALPVPNEMGCAGVRKASRRSAARASNEAGVDEQYDVHLRKLLMDVVFRFTEMGRQEEALPWFSELKALGMPGTDELDTSTPLLRRSGSPRKRDEPQIKKETSYWMDSLPKSNNASIPSRLASGSTLPVDKGKGKEIAPPAAAIGSTPRVEKGKAKEVKPPSSSGTNGHRLADEEIFSPEQPEHNVDLQGLGTWAPPRATISLALAVVTSWLASSAWQAAVWLAREWVVALWVGQIAQARARAAVALWVVPAWGVLVA